MSRSRFLRAPGVDEPVLSVTTLIDVSFLLLIYFLVTSTLHKREADLGMSLPTMLGPTAIGPPFEVTLNSSGFILVNNELLETDLSSRSLPTLLQRLRTYKRAASLIGDDTSVIIRADDDARGQRLIDVLNALATAEIDKVSMEGF